MAMSEPAEREERLNHVFADLSQLGFLFFVLENPSVNLRLVSFFMTLYVSFVKMLWRSESVEKSPPSYTADINVFFKIMLLKS